MVLLEKTNCSLLNSLAYSGLSDSKDDAGVTGMRKYERVIWEKGAMHSNFLPFHFRVCALSILQTWLSRNLEQTPPMIIGCFFFIPFVYLLIKKKNGWITVLILASPLDGEWGPWTPWTQCSQTCGISGGSILSRTRLCNQPPPMNGGKPCAGNDTETAKSCLTPCPG